MTNQEFSDAFDVLLNSYNTKAVFGDQASKQEIVLDEFEKSILLTQAQDIIVKSYFDRTLNPQGQGFDDSTRRQVDFSSLIKVAELSPINTPDYASTTINVFWNDPEKGSLGLLRITNIFESAINLTIQLSNDTSSVPVAASITGSGSNTNLNITIYPSVCDTENLRTTSSIINRVLNSLVAGTGSNYVKDYIDIVVSSGHNVLPSNIDYSIYSGRLSEAGTDEIENVYTFDKRGKIFTLPSKTIEKENGESYIVSDVLFILNEKMVVGDKDYVIVPINYMEYDREMSKPYAQPLKKQAWRLFQNAATGFDIHSELIPKWNINTSSIIYRIRYVKRPRPIVLEDFDNLEIDGIHEETSCELNPILHADILNKAVELAINTRGGGTAVRQERNQ